MYDIHHGFTVISVGERAAQQLFRTLRGPMSMKQLGKYKIIEEIGQGGMGTVYRARDEVIGRDVAVKVIHERALHVPEIKERLYREARSAGQLAHENIMIIYDVGEQDGDPYIVMELLRGSSLRQLMREGVALSLLDKLEVAVQICDGLQYAHQHGIIHRDIKPDNIQVLEAGRVKILDFGIARVESEARTITHASIGTPRYMSPEQIKGRNLDHRTDIFSFGVVLYELLTGSNPFPGEHVTTIIYKILHEPPEPIRLENSVVSDDLQAIVSTCLEKDPGDRYQSFADVVDDLTRAMLKIRDETVVLPAAAARRFRTTPVRRSTAELPEQTASNGTAATGAPARRVPSWSYLVGAGAVVAIGLAAFLVLWPRSDSGVAVENGATAMLEETQAPRDEEALAAELAQLQERALEEQARMLEAKSAAEASDAPRLVPELYQEAAALEEAASAALARGDAPGFQAAETAFRDAERQFSDAVLRTSENRLEVVQRQAEEARRSVRGLRGDVEQHRESGDLRSNFAAADRLYESAEKSFAAKAYEQALQAYRQAEDRYGSLRQTAETARTEARQEMEEVRATALASRQNAAAHRSDAGLAENFREADALVTAAERFVTAQQYEAARERFEGADRAYRQIVRLAGERESTRLSALRAQAEQARTEMTAARGSVREAQQATPAYRAAAEREEAARRAFSTSDYELAAREYAAAAAGYRDAATATAADATAADAPAAVPYEPFVQDLTRRLQAGFEEEDLASLRALSSFFDSWGDFFAVAHDISSNVTTSAVRVDGTTGTFSLQLSLRYMNNKNQRDVLNVPLRLTIAREGNAWSLSSVEAQ